ncbi:hypothetical protein COP1_024206 [Malus domestica]
MTHLASVLILLLKIHTIKLCVGISWKTQKLYAIVFATRYLDDTADASKKAFETVQRSCEFTVEASKKADEIKTATLKQADQIKSLFVSEIIPPQLSSLSIVNSVSVSYSRFLNWMPAALRMLEPKLINHAGLDSAVYLRIYLIGCWYNPGPSKGANWIV